MVGFADSVDPLIDSLDGLEILVLIARDRLRSWTAAQVAAQLRISERSALDELEGLRRRGVLSCDASQSERRYRWAAVDGVHLLATRVVELYDNRRIELINYVATSSLKRIRNLADAFRIRGTDPS